MPRFVARSRTSPTSLPKGMYVGHVVEYNPGYSEDPELIFDKSRIEMNPYFDILIRGDKRYNDLTASGIKTRVYILDMSRSFSDSPNSTFNKFREACLGRPLSREELSGFGGDSQESDEKSNQELLGKIIWISVVPTTRGYLRVADFQSMTDSDFNLFKFLKEGS